MVGRHCTTSRAAVEIIKTKPYADRSLLTCRGHRPAATLSRLDLPLPLGPMIKHERPGCTSKLISFTSITPSGELRYTLRGAIGGKTTAGCT